LELLAMRPEKEAELLPLITSRMDLTVASIKNVSSENVTDEPVTSFSEDEDYDIEVSAISDEMTSAEENISIDIYSEQDKEADDEPIYEEYQAPDKLPPVFCLNDKFRFKRAIFSGSDIDFNAAMQHVATLDDYESAEQYFFGEKGLDPDNEDVMDFMDVLKTYFGA
ncbi:MAG: hypothetical protein K2M87_03995, partial [Muribaculaceae bacterium]|nr:hypothetical protein [Muribaculaceae bacterium]